MGQRYLVGISGLVFMYVFLFFLALWCTSCASVPWRADVRCRTEYQVGAHPRLVCEAGGSYVPPSGIYTLTSTLAD